MKIYKRLSSKTSSSVIIYDRTMNVVFVILYKANMTMIIEANEFAFFVLQVICLTNLLGLFFRSVSLFRRNEVDL